MTCALLTCGGTAAALSGPAGPAYGDPAGPAPVANTRTALQTFTVSPSGPARAGATATSRDTGPDAAAGVTQRRTRPFSLLGATWTDPDAPLGTAVQVRTRRAGDGRWTGWHRLDVDEPSAADPGPERDAGRGSTDPLWVGESDGVEARVAGPAGTLPAGLRLDLVDPDASATAPGTASVPATGTASVPATGIASAPATGTAGRRVAAGRVRAGSGVPPRPAPRVVTRSGWGADESIARPVEYTADVQAFFVHHTATGNNYRCADSAAIIRGIQAYHVRSKGWNDVGYNLLMDKCGTLYEGRRGSLTRAVLGAHTLGFNARSAGLAVIGDHTGSGVSATVRQAIARIAAYKLGTYGNNPAGRVTLVSAGSNKHPRGARVRMNRVAGHRDAVQTTCPGNGLYRQLSTIRRVAGGTVRRLGLDRLAGSSQRGSVFHTRGVITARWSTRTASSFIARFDLLVDGRLAARVPGGHRGAVLRFTPGHHTLRVRAVHLSGRVATTRAYAIHSDRKDPAFTGEPVAQLRRGAVGTTVPLTLGWRVTDEGGLRSVVLNRPGRATFDPTRTAWVTGARAGAATTWALTATDQAGNTAGATVTRTPVVMPEGAAAPSGAWSAVRHPAHLGGSALQSTAAGASLSWTFTGRGTGLLFSRSAHSGRAAVSVDGRPVATVDLLAASSMHRQMAWVYNWRSAEEHTVTVTIEGTVGRPAVVVDGLVHLR